MRNIFKNKKTIISLALAFVVIASGATYAWFTSTAGANTSAGLGALKVVAKMFEEYTEDATGDLIRVYPDDPGYVAPNPLAYTSTETWFEPNTLYQPGTEGIAAFEVFNPNPDGDALNFVVKMSGLDGKVEIWSDADGNKLAAPIVYNNIADLLASYPGAVLRGTFDGLTEPGTYFYVDAADNYLGAVSWFYDRTAFDATGQYEYYVMMTPDMKTDYAVQIAFDGPAMGNSFQRAKFFFDAAFVATQSLDAAIEAKWPGVFLIEAGGYHLVTLSGSGNAIQSASAPQTSKFANFTIEDALRYAFPERYR